jgi:hypothetical protein
VKYGETPYATLQRQTAVGGGGAAILPSEENGGRKGVVREHQWHTTRTSEVLVRTGRSRAVLATCAVKGTAAHRANTRAPPHLQPCLRPNYDEHQHWKVKGSPRVRAIELRMIVEAYPQRALYGGELTGSG